MNKEQFIEIMTDFQSIRQLLTDNKLKVTPQRIAVLEALKEVKHPSAENIIEYIRQNHPNIATGTIYNILDTFVEKNIIIRLKTETGIMRYDANINYHHHLYCCDSNRIEDYFDETLTGLINDYISKIDIPGFSAESINLQIIGKFAKQ